MHSGICVTLWYGVYSYIHILDGVVFPFLAVVLGQPVYNENFGPRFVYNLDPFIDEFLIKCIVCAVTVLLHLF